MIHIIYATAHAGKKSLANLLSEEYDVTVITKYVANREKQNDTDQFLQLLDKPNKASYWLETYPDAGRDNCENCSNGSGCKDSADNSYDKCCYRYSFAYDYYDTERNSNDISEDRKREIEDHYKIFNAKHDNKESQAYEWYFIPRKELDRGVSNNLHVVLICNHLDTILKIRKVYEDASKGHIVRLYFLCSDRQPEYDSDGRDKDSHHRQAHVKKTWEGLNRDLNHFSGIIWNENITGYGKAAKRSEALLDTINKGFRKYIQFVMGLEPKKRKDEESKEFQDAHEGSGEMGSNEDAPRTSKKEDDGDESELKSPEEGEDEMGEKSKGSNGVEVRIGDVSGDSNVQITLGNGSSSSNKRINYSENEMTYKIKTLGGDDLRRLIKELETLKNEQSDETGEAIDSAIAAAKHKDECAFSKSWKKIGHLIGPAAVSGLVQGGMTILPAILAGLG